MPTAKSAEARVAGGELERGGNDFDLGRIALRASYFFRTVLMMEGGNISPSPQPRVRRHRQEHFGNQARSKFESSRYGERSKIQKSSKFKFNPHPFLQPRQRTLRRNRGGRATDGLPSFRPHESALTEDNLNRMQDGRTMRKSRRAAAGRAELLANFFGGAV